MTREPTTNEASNEARAESSTATFRADENALVNAASSMLASVERGIYLSRASALLTDLARRAFPTEALTKFLRALALDLPAPRFESRGALLLRIMERTNDDEAICRFLLSIMGRRDLVRPLVVGVSHMTSPFAILARLLTAALPADLRNFLEDQIVDASRTRPEAFSKWAVNSRGLFLRREVFEVLLARAADHLSGAVRALLQDGVEEERVWLMERLVREGTAAALRMLALGLGWGSQPRNPALLRAIGRFHDPLAVALLVEAIHRNNVAGGRGEEAAAAVEALGAMGTEPANDELRRIARGRVCGLPLYRASIRRLARRALAQPVAAA